jgi:hypothetical protein
LKRAVLVLIGISLGAAFFARGALATAGQSVISLFKGSSGTYVPANLDSSGNLKVNVAAGGASGGTSSSFGSAFPATGTAIGFKDSAGTNMAAGNLDASGFLKVNVAAGGGSGGTSSSFGAAIPGTGTAAGFSDGTNMQLGRVFDADSGAGTQYVAGVSLRKIASGGSVEAGTSSDPLRTDPTGTTPQPASQSGTWTVQPGNTANTTAWKVDGSAVTQPVSGTVTANQGGTWTVQPGNTANTTAWKVDGSAVTQPVSGTVTGLSDGTNTAKVLAASTAPAAADKAVVVAISPQAVTTCSTTKAVSQTASTDLVTSTNKLHICSIVLVSDTAQFIALVTGTGSTCGTGGAAVIGSTTVGSGVSLAANGGFSAVSDRPWLKTATTGDHLCLLQSGAGRLSGVITYQDAP